MKYKAKDIKESREAALKEIKQFLEAEDINGQFDSRSGDYCSKEKFIVTWKGNYGMIASEYGIDKVDSFYTAVSGYRAIYSHRSLIHEKQIKGYVTIERALLEIGLKLSPKEEKKQFFDKYVVPYNERLK